MNVAHTGIVLFILGILLSNTFKLELTEQLHSGPLGAKRLGPAFTREVCCLRSIDHSFAPTYHSICANLIVANIVNIDGPAFTRLGYRAFAHNLNPDPRKGRTSPPGAFGGRAEKQLYAGLRQDLRREAVQVRHDAGPGSGSRLTGSSVCMFPEKRFYYSNQGAIATKVAIHSNLFTDFYSLIGTGSFETGWFTTIMKLPFIFCIWLGFMFGVFGGALAVKKQLQKSKLFWL